MDTTTIALATGTTLVIALLAATTGRARTAPAPFVIALVVGTALAFILALSAFDATGSAGTIMLVTLALLILVMLGSLIAVGTRRTPSTYEAEGTDRNAIQRACEAHGQADRTITAFTADRGAKSPMQRLRDAFVTTETEIGHLSAVAVRNAARAHLTDIVPPWHRMRTEALVDENAVRPVVDMIETRLRPLEAVEEAARDVHRSAMDAVTALDEAIEALDSAQTYETLDLVTDNKGLSAVSTMANSTAQDRVAEAREAIDVLSRKTKAAIDEDLIAPGDTLDLFLDMAFDPGFDFLSLYNIGRLADARSRCEEARGRVAEIEARLRESHQAAHDAAQPVRDEIAAVKRPYHQRAMTEMPEIARTFVPA